MKPSYTVKCAENEVQLFSARFVTNGSSAVATKTANLASVTRTAAGKYTVVFKVASTHRYWPQVLGADVKLVGAAGYKPYITEVSTDSKGACTGIKIETWDEGAVTGAVAATGTLTCDTKANSTARDYFILNDGSNKAMISYNVAGTDAAKYSKLGAKATATVTFPAFADVTNEDYFTAWDGHRFWKIMLDTDGSGDSTGTADLVVNITGLTTAIQVATAVHNVIQETTSIPGYTEAIHLTSTDNGNGTLTLTCDIPGYAGNGTNTENFTHASGTITAATGGTDAFPAEEFSHVDISSATTAAQVAALLVTAINALTEVQITAGTPTGGAIPLTNDNAGTHGNVSQQLSETGSTAMALTDMTGGVDGTRAAAAAADTTAYQVFIEMLFRNSQRTFK